MHPLRGHCDKNIGLVTHSQAISTPQIEEERAVELLTNLRERELLLSIALSMKPTLLFAFCALITLVSSAPAQAPQHNPAQAEVAALITEVRAQQAAIAANQVKINEKLATLAESIRVARIYSSRGGR